MYCKYCGNQIAENSVFCSKCGKLVVEAGLQSNIQSPTTNEMQWLTTENLQWRKPLAARYTQIIIIIILGMLSLYPLYCFISGGKVREYYGKNQRHEVYVNDPWKLKILKFTSVKMYNWNNGDNIVKYGHFSKSDAQDVFRWKMLLVLLPFTALLWLTIRWMKWTRFPGEKDIVPRDVADEIEQYEWNGFSKSKYIFYKKSGKYGVIDARNYCVDIPAQYDSIVWRMPNKTFDVTIGEEKQILSIKKKASNYNPNKKEINEKNIGVFVVRAICVLLTLFTFVAPLISILLPDDTTSQATIVQWFIASVVFAIITYFVFKNTKVINQK